MEDFIVTPFFCVDDVGMRDAISVPQSTFETLLEGQQVFADPASPLSVTEGFNIGDVPRPIAEFGVTDRSGFEKLELPHHVPEVVEKHLAFTPFVQFLFGTPQVQVVEKARMLQHEFPFDGEGEASLEINRDILNGDFQVLSGRTTVDIYVVLGEKLEPGVNALDQSQGLLLQAFFNPVDRFVTLVERFHSWRIFL